MEDVLYLDEIVNNYITENDYPDSSYERLYSIAIRCYRQLHFHATGKPETYEMEVLANKTSKLPCNFLSKIAIGILNNNREIVSLTEDSTLGLIERQTRLSIPTQNTDSFTEERLFDASNNNLGYGINRQYGLGSRSDLGFYRIDFDNQIVVYSPDLPYSSIWIEYLPIAGTDNNNYIVHPFFQEAVIAWLGWHDRKKTLSEKVKHESEYYNHLRIGNRSMKPFDPHDVYNSYRKMASQAPRA